MIAVFQAAVFLGHWLIYVTLVRFLGLQGTAALRSAFAALSISFLAASVLVFRRRGRLVSAFYSFSAAWMGFFHFLFWSSVLCWIVHWAYAALGLDSGGLTAALLAVGPAAGFYGIANALNPRIKKINFAFPEPPAGQNPGRDAHGFWSGKTAVFISDLHLGPVRGARFAGRVAKRIREIGPDILFIGGDLYDGAKTDAGGFFLKPFAQINPLLGTYFITGNHEEFSGSAKKSYEAAATEAGMTVLDNRMVEIGGLRVVGVDYLGTHTRAQYRRVLREMGLGGGRPVLLLKHSPMYPDVSIEEGVTFELCGHTHKGQIFPYGIITHYVYGGFDSGLRKLGGLTLYTSTGAGTWGPPMRVGNRPEIVVVRFT